MRARRAAAFVLLWVAVVTAGCGSGDASGGGELSLLPLSARPPRVGNCYWDTKDVAFLVTDTPMECAETHRAETVGLGSFVAPYAESPRPPVALSAGLREAFTDCDKQAQAYVGGDWRGAALSLQVVVPEPERWSVGLRWYRCELFELAVTDTVKGEPTDVAIERTGSLRGVIKAGKLPAYSCFSGTWEKKKRASCSQKHRFEYVGIWTAPDLTWKDLEAKSKGTFRECRRVINVFLGLPKDSAVGMSSGVAFRMPSRKAWDRGDRGVRCFLWSSVKVQTRSLRGSRTLTP